MLLNLKGECNLRIGTLTDSLDNLTGDAGNNTFIGDGTTVSVGDKIDGGEGTDTVELYGTTKVPQLTSVENVVFDDVTAAIDLSDRSVSSTTIQNSTFTAANTNVALGASSLTLDNVDVDTAADALDISSTAASLSVTLNDVGIGDDEVTLNLQESTEDITELSLETTGSKSEVLVTDTDDKLATVTITGDQGLKLTNAAITSLTTIDGSAATGALNVIFGAAADVSITTGTADDTVQMASANFDKEDKVSGGEGTDTLQITGSTAISTSNDLDVTDFETLKIGGANLTADVAFNLDNVSGITTVVMTEEGTNTLTTPSHSFTLTDLATSTTTFNFMGDGTDDVQGFEGLVVDYDSTSAVSSVEVNVGNDGTEGKSFEIEDIVLNNVESVTMNVADVGTGSGEKLTFNSAVDINDAKTFTLVSNSDVDFAGGITGGADLELIDASDADAGVSISNITDFKAGATISLGDGNDSITSTNAGTTDNVVLDAGDGSDIIDLNTVTNGHEITTGGGSDVVKFVGDTTDVSHTITDFSAGTGGDTLDFDTNSAAGTGITASGYAEGDLSTGITNGMNVETANTIASLTSAAVAGDLGAALNGAGDNEVYVIFSDGTDAALFYVDDTAGATAGTVEAAEVTLIATLEGLDLVGVTALDANNFSDFI